MILVPAVGIVANHRLYRDSEDELLLHVDALEPVAARGGDAARWVPVDSDQAYLVADVRFGPSESARRHAAENQDERRTVPVSWSSSPVYAWCRHGDGVWLLARGKTSGYGSHNVVVSATAPSEAMSAPLAIAAELSTQARLAGAALRGSGDWAAVGEALVHVPMGHRAPWSATLADVLLPALKELVNDKTLTLTVEDALLPLGALEELRDLALIEWAHRLLPFCVPTCNSLAQPAAEIERLSLDGAFNPNISWMMGDVIPLRAVRVLRRMGVVEGGPVLDTVVDVAAKVFVSGDSDWSCYDYVTVSMSSGATHTDVTLTRAKTEVDHRPLGASPTVSAFAGVRGYGARIPIDDVHIDGSNVEVRLASLQERALLVSADRELLRQTGPLTVRLTHPAAAKVLVPSDGVVVLDIEDGDLPTLSVVYRALLWQAGASKPFDVQVRLPSGNSIGWSDVARDGVVMVDSTRLPLIRVAASPLEPSHSVAVELSQTSPDSAAARTSLGSKEIVSGELALWLYDPVGGPLWLRSRYPGAGDEPYWTAWHEVEPDGAVLAPQFRIRAVAVKAGSDIGSTTEVELAPFVGEGGAIRVRVGPGQVVKADLVDDVGGGGIRYRVRDLDDAGNPVTSAWSSWKEIEGNVVKLDRKSYPKGKNHASSAEV